MHLPPRFRHLLLSGVLVGVLAAAWFLHDASQDLRAAVPNNTVRIPTSVHPSVSPTRSHVSQSLYGPSFSTLTNGLRPGRGGPIPDARTVQALPVVDVAFYNARGNLLSGWLAINTPEAPVIILTHGTPGNRASMISRAAFLYQHGYSTLLFDFQSYGRSQGEVSTLGMVESEDVEAAITYVHDLPATRQSKIGVLGLSMGATAAVLAASRTHDIGALVAESCPVDATRVAADVPDDEARTADQWLVEETYGVDITQARPIDVVQKLAPSTALFFINGDADTITPLAGMYALYQAAEAPKQYWVVSGAGHAQSFTVSTQEYMTRVSAFFDTYLGSRYHLGLNIR
jgi:alpha/beta superfamily hydrolase